MEVAFLAAIKVILVGPPATTATSTAADVGMRTFAAAYVLQCTCFCARVWCAYDGACLLSLGLGSCRLMGLYGLRTPLSVC